MTTAIFFALEGTLLVDPGNETDGDGGETPVADLEVPDGAREALATLAADNHLGVITNADDERVRAAVDIHDFPVGTVVTAAEAGAPKPDPAPFELARERVAADEYVMVGDDYERDVRGARQAGFVPIHYEDEGPSLWKTLTALV